MSRYDSILSVGKIGKEDAGWGHEARNPEMAFLHTAENRRITRLGPYSANLPNVVLLATPKKTP